MFNAEDAQRLVSDFYRRGEAVSQEWVVTHLQSAISAVHEASKHGDEFYDYEVCLEKETYKQVKKRLLMYAISRLGFKVSISETHKRDGHVLKYTVYEISWGKPINFGADARPTPTAMS